MDGGWKKLETDMIIRLKLNLLIVKQFGEQRCCAIVQYSLRLYLEIVGSLIQYFIDISRERFTRYVSQYVLKSTNVKEPLSANFASQKMT